MYTKLYDYKKVAPKPRNSLIDPSNVLYLITDQYFQVLLPLLDENSQNDELTRRITWQIIYNSCVNRGDFTNFAIQKLSPKVILEKLSREVQKTQNVICAFISLKIETFATADNNMDTFKVINNLRENCDFALIAILAMLKVG